MDDGREGSSGSMRGFGTLVSIFLALVLCGGAAFFLVPHFFPITYDSVESATGTNAAALSMLPAKRVVTHVPTPAAVKGLYMTSWVAGTKHLRENLVKLADETEINTIVIDIKDYTGVIAFPVPEGKLTAFASPSEVRITDMEDLIDELHAKGIYVAGRISVFQDARLSKTRPDLAVKRASDGAVWKDRKGVSWLDAGSTEVWDYVTELSKYSYELGFDEVNFDYIRFPSDGDMKDIGYPFSEGKSKPETLKSFFEYLHGKLAGTGVVTSADLFGMTTTSTDDLGIGQVLENALPYFDYVAPMVYPSHYPATWNGYKNPAEHPYEVIHDSMSGAVAKAVAASTTPDKLRPWLQDFDLGAVYTPAMVREQIQATYDVGLDSWLLWDASNKYKRRAALLPQ
jgi:hypothetical protein